MVCQWYDDKVCPQRKCDGNGSVYCKIMEKGIKKSEGEYRRIKQKTQFVSKSHCYSFLERTAIMPQVRHLTQ